jgi:hypothetical protein
MSERLPAVAVGSNACPSQILAKFRRRSVQAVVPMTLADVTGIVPGFSAHVSVPGYIPAAPVQAPGELSRLFVLWLDHVQLAALDATEPNYWRRRLDDRQFPVKLASGAHSRGRFAGAHSTGCFVYVGKHGCLLDRAGEPRRLTTQTSLITTLLAESPALRSMCGETAAEFLVRAQDPGVRNAVRLLFIKEERAGPQPGLAGLLRA